ncbi:oxidoreductase, 2OG-Fe(II) oxygenase family [Aspergillus saccharolyticus JOP 1030-1]|uniref:mRNA N(6)-methyladenine demethylase n=1 Tax=Aspergillus saccharolyticus JOP 1030-1 TaxID=1450539 RepID=A0A318ZCG2_9EURO|nr:oxidoreductase [Aspergillus saccharolyticus JOP 1030-1]PYH45039.1 oxidoreductase [Aspergillus saccharolyticus JOP 1030-1]
MAQIKDLNAHERPPEAVRQRYKQYQKSTLADINSDAGVLDLQALDANRLPEVVSLTHWISGKDLQPVFDEFLGTSKDGAERLLNVKDIPVFSHRSVTGLQIIPSLLPPAVQIELLSRLFHRDLSNPRHKTNLHLHYDLTYPSAEDAAAAAAAAATPTPEPNVVDSQPLSFFEDDPTRLIHPKDPSVHKPLSVQSILTKKLRWVTLGGQYDWTAKVYPAERPPEFPPDIAKLLHTMFPETEAQAAILNVYSPGDTLSPHRDVSEECDAGLISISFGCDGLFLISHDDGAGCEIIRLRSGDAVYMDGTSRFAWHAVPKIVPSTCPTWLVDWPGAAEGSDAATISAKYEMWKGWMAGKRINLNVRQMSLEEPR